jgi:hypothetical protein
MILDDPVVRFQAQQMGTEMERERLMEERRRRRVDEDPAVLAARAALREAQEMVALAERAAWGEDMIYLPPNAMRKLAKLRSATPST